MKDKLVNIQSKLKAPKNQNNLFGKYNYRNCEDILEAAKPLMKEEGVYLTINDAIEIIGERTYIKATASLSDGVKVIETSAFAREPETQKGMSDSQITGSTSSYARKYALNGLFCIDDTKDSDSMDNTQSNKKGGKPVNNAQNKNLDDKYNKIISDFEKLVNKDINEAYKDYKNVDDIRDTKLVAQKMIRKKATELNLVLDKETNLFEKKAV